MRVLSDLYPKDSYRKSNQNSRVPGRDLKLLSRGPVHPEARWWWDAKQISESPGDVFDWFPLYGTVLASKSGMQHTVDTKGREEQISFRQPRVLRVISHPTILARHRGTELEGSWCFNFNLPAAFTGRYTTDLSDRMCPQPRHATVARTQRYVDVLPDAMSYT